MDYQRVVEFLRDFRTAPIQTVTDEVRAAATEYAELCAAANERLRQCAVLLQRGLRAEAINLAESSPNLLDLVTALDLPAADRWAEFCQREDLPVPPQLQIERASLLNDAYGQEQPLEALYARHRRLALAQAAVQKRLAVMRQIAQVDPSPFWDKDIRIFEHARFKELRVSFSVAIRDKDVATITALSQELLESPWIGPVPSDLQSAARDVNDRIRLVQFDSAIREVAARLQSAYEARSHEKCSTLLEKVNELMGAYGLTNLPGDTASLVEAAGKWVKKENEAQAARAAFESACDALTAGLDADAPNSELEALYSAAASHGPAVPNELQKRCQLTIKRRANAGTRRVVLIVAVAAAFLLAGALVTNSILRAREESQWAQKIHSAAAGRELALAKKLIEDQERESPRLNAASDVTSAKREVEDLQRQADTDGATLRSALGLLAEAKGKANAAAQAEDAAGASPTSTASLDGLRDAVSAVSDALGRRSQLPDLSWVDPHASLGQATKDLEARRQDLLARYERGVLARVRAVADRAKRLDGATVGPVAEALAVSVEHDLSGLRGYITSGSEAAAADDVGRKIAAYRETARNNQDFAEALKALPENADGPDGAVSARDALTEFARRFPSAPLSKDLLRAAAATDLYRSVDAWPKLSTGWAADPAPASEKDALHRLELVRAFLRDYPSAPDAPNASRYADYLQQAAEAMAVQNTWQTAMDQAMTWEPIRDLKYVQTTNGKRYYVLGELKAHHQTMNERDIFTFDAIDPQNPKHRLQVKLLPPTALVSPTPLPMPHTVFVETLAEDLKTVNGSNWDTFGIDLSARIAAAPDIDPVVKGILLWHAVTATNQALSWASIDLYEKPVDDLVRQKLDDVVWFDLDHPVPAALTANLNRIFTEVPKPADVRKLLEAGKAGLFKTLRRRFNGYGLLLRDDSGHWSVQARGVPLPGAKAKAIVPAPGHGAPASPAEPPVVPSVPVPPASQPAGGAASQPAAPANPPPAPANPASFVTVAEWKNGAWVVDESAIHDLPQGTLLLISIP